MREYLGLTRTFILIYALSSAALYSGLMPPWEGFDELYHYGVVQRIATTGHVLQDGKTTLSRELWNSLDYLPVSHYIQPYLERPSMSFEEYFRLTAEQRTALRRGADTLERTSRYEPSPRVNYEAEQTPLTYILLAPLDAALSGATLHARVLALRLFLSFLTIALLWEGTRRLAVCIGLEGPLEAGCLLVVFSSQVFYAETCRVGNDALAAPWLVWFLLASVEFAKVPEWKGSVQTAILMALGLLIKSYLLVFVPLAFVVPAALFLRGRWRSGEALKHATLSAGIICALAGPWYVRAMLKYHNLTPTVNVSGINVPGLLRAAAGLPWGKSIATMAQGALWTGNNSFVTFSHSTLDGVLVLLVVSLVLYSLRAQSSFAEVITITAAGLYCAILIAMAIEYFRSSGGLIFGAMSWYAPVLLVPVVGLGFLGLRRWGRIGRWIAAATVVLWAYVAAVSWIAKLIPLYGGLQDYHGHPSQLLSWYLHSSGHRDSVLRNLSPAPLPMIYLLLAVVIVTLVGTSVRVVTAILRGEPAES